ncbi:MotA/TolQ/ExbB proton channel family protein [uncultured Microscilla sp.]|uniref:MotA/TolQ/ExbB proton channel family protein n=1 Tax=uncultured Microscilla sp. TaxID=432653 RepID=UPI00260E5AB1|nr:MotA/TolQ/ExbB proton channel family protein [uncultured Microscilla sp.]
MKTFFDFIVNGGLFFTLPLTLFAGTILFFGVRLGLELFVAERALKPRVSKSLDTIIYLGGFSFIFGILGQLVGLYEAFTVLSKVGAVSPKILMAGLKVSTIPTLYGFGILLTASIIWFVFRRKLQSLTDQD